ncbi:putative permease [Dictyocaulus viviparus]|uniref:Putative permease n=1 Tax=Dictyocaulus viviparus TaxID=29172 RepID=A0A0D8XCN0_DICVI|nr:putative permease [Dictyocaulus viviparus]
MVANPDATNREPLQLRVNDVPTWSAALMFGLQQAMLCLSGLLVFPFIVSEVVCAGNATVELRVQLIASTFVSCGIATILQTTFGLRLCVLHGPALAFLPPLLAYKALRSSECPFTEDDTVATEIWQSRIQEISGSLFIACISFLVIGGTGLAGVVSKLIGPITIVPLMILLTTSIVPTIEVKLSLHWISLVYVFPLQVRMLASIIAMAVYLEHVIISIPYYSFNKKRFITTKTRLFGQFPYLMSILFVWFICYLLTITGAEPVGGQARTDKNLTMAVLRKSPWFQIPYPGQFGMPSWNIGLCFGFVASCMSSVIENIGSYDLLARVSQQRSPPNNAVNRAIMIEGFGSMLAAAMGVCTGVTTFAENIALIHITKVASRITMQIAGVLLVIFGSFTKIAALLASIPDALIGGVLTMGISMIAGVAMSNLKLIDLKLTRNLSIIGLSLIIGLVVPLHLERSPIRSGATLRQRGLYVIEDDKKIDIGGEHENGYAFPEYLESILRALPILQVLPFLPSYSTAKISPHRDQTTVTTNIIL